MKHVDVKPMPGLEHCRSPRCGSTRSTRRGGAKRRQRRARSARRARGVDDRQDAGGRRVFRRARLRAGASLRHLRARRHGGAGSRSAGFPARHVRRTPGPRAARCSRSRCESYPDQPGRSETAASRAFEEWRVMGARPAPPEAYFVALDDERVLGYGFLDFERRRVVERLHGDRARGRADGASQARSSAVRSRGRRSTACARCARRTRRGSKACSRSTGDSVTRRSTPRSCCAVPRRSRQAASRRRSSPSRIRSSPSSYALTPSS